MPPKRRSIVDRFTEKVVESENGCLEWTGGKFGNGYGMLYPGPDSETKKLLAHRWSYEHFVGPIPEGFVIDHLCKNISCVNPDHLEPVSQRRNVLRGESFSAANARKTHCIHGHEFAGDNLISSERRRECRECRRQRDRKRRPRSRKAA